MDSLTETFCLIDDFWRVFEPAFNRRLLASGPKKRRVPRTAKLPARRRTHAPLRGTPRRAVRVPQGPV
jgi:hypothetical protein